MKKLCVLVSILFLILSCSTSKQERRHREENQLLRERCKRVFDSLQREITELSYINDSLTIPNIDFIEDRELNPETGMRQIPAETMEEREQDLEVYQEIIMQPETISKVRNEIWRGKLAFYCPKTMIYGQKNDVYGFINDLISDEQLRKILIERVREHEPDLQPEEMDDHILIKKIENYDLIELSLDNSANSDFKIDKIHDHDKQEVSEFIQDWHWKVTPTSSKTDQQLVLTVRAYNNDGKTPYAFNKTYKFKVEVKKIAYWERLRELYLNDPAIALTQVILPFLTFLGGVFAGRRKKEEAGK